MSYDSCIMVEESLNSASLVQEWEKFQMRIRVLLQNIEGGRPYRIAKRFEEMGRKVHPSTVTRWINPEYQLLPDVPALILILRMWPNVSANWLFGRRLATTTDEKFIEARVVSPTTKPTEESMD